MQAYQRISTKITVAYTYMLASYDAATTEGTKRNRARQADVYIRFCLTHGLDYFNPSVFTISLFAQYLANSFKAPAIWRNYIRLRRGAALASVAAGATFEDIRAMGLWRSDAVYNYVPRSAFSSAPSALATTLGQ